MTSTWLLESGSEKRTKLILAYVQTVLCILCNESYSLRKFLDERLPGTPFDVGCEIF